MPVGEDAPNTNREAAPAASPGDDAAVRRGLSAPHGPVLDELESPSRRPARRLVLQGLGFLLSMAALGWALSLALSGENRGRLSMLRDADPAVAALLVAATTASMAMNGTMFWLLIRPYKRIGWIGVQATNAIAVFLSILPFKLGLVTRALIHHRRDGVPFKLLVAWMAGMAALGVAAFLPLGVAGLWFGTIDARWALVAGGGFLGTHAAGWVCARLALNYKVLSRLSLGSDMLLRDGRLLAAMAAARLADAGILSARFYLAAKLTGTDLPPDLCVLLGTTFFLISVVSPGGALGFRESGVAALALAKGFDEQALALVAVLVSLTEVLTSGGLAIIGCAIVRPDRLLLRPQSR